MQTITGKLEIVERMKNSQNGNPRYVVNVGGYECMTKPDSDYAYGLTNLVGKTVTAQIGKYYGRDTLFSVE